MPSAPILDRELTTLEAAVRADPADIGSRGRLADLYLAAERYDDAIAQYTEIIKTGKQDEAGYVSRGRALELKGDIDAAAADYQKVVDIAKSSEMANVDQMLEVAYYGLGAISLQHDKPDEAIGSLLKALVIKRTDADAMNLLGAAYVKAGKADQAIEPLRKAILFVPVGWADPYRTLSDAYKATNEPELAEWAGAMADLQAGDAATAESRLLAITDGKAAVDANIGLGLVAETRGDTAGAADWYRKAIAIEPKNESALLGLSRVTDGAGAAHPSAQPSQPAASQGEGSN
jgi:tetratricopeptide (TPR) repeat protein